MSSQAVYLSDDNSQHGDEATKSDNCPNWPIKAYQILSLAMMECDDDRDLDRVGQKNQGE